MTSRGWSVSSAAQSRNDDRKPVRPPQGSYKSHKCKRIGRTSSLCSPCSTPHCKPDGTAPRTPAADRSGSSVPEGHSQSRPHPDCPAPGRRRAGCSPLDPELKPVDSWSSDDDGCLHTHRFIDRETSPTTLPAPLCARHSRWRSPRRREKGHPRVTCHRDRRGRGRQASRCGGVRHAAGRPSWRWTDEGGG